MSLSIVILAAGLGKRMKSNIPKPLQLLGGRPMITHLYQTAQKISDSIYVVYGQQQEDSLKRTLPDSNCQWVCQDKQLGTAHAVQQVLPFLETKQKILVLYADAPLISEVILKELIASTNQQDLGLITTIVDHPYGLGRVVRDQEDNFLSIVEEHEATKEQLLLTEINTGIGLFPGVFLKEILPELSNNNNKQEFYLTDVFAVARERVLGINLLKVPYSLSLLGVNDRVQLGELERYYQLQQAQWLQRQGVCLLDAKRFDCRGDVQIGNDCVIDVGVIFEGEVILGDYCHIGPYSYLKDCELGDNVNIEAHCVLDGAKIKRHAKIGPFARIRPESVIGEQAKIGNFVEVKKSNLGKGTKVNHLAYVGDAEIGKQVNIGAGAITCNYDGHKKHMTVIKDNVFIGSNSSLVAPLEIGASSVVGAGTVVTKTVPDNNLVLSRVKQKNIDRLIKKSRE